MLFPVQVFLLLFRVVLSKRDYINSYISGIGTPKNQNISCSACLLALFHHMLLLAKHEFRTYHVVLSLCSFNI